MFGRRIRRDVSCQATLRSPQGGGGNDVSAGPLFKKEARRKPETRDRGTSTHDLSSGGGGGAGRSSSGRTGLAGTLPFGDMARNRFTTVPAATSRSDSGTSGGRGARVGAHDMIVGTRVVDKQRRPAAPAGISPMSATANAATAASAAASAATGGGGRTRTSQPLLAFEQQGQQGQHDGQGEAEGAALLAGTLPLVQYNGGTERGNTHNSGTNGHGIGDDTMALDAWAHISNDSPPLPPQTTSVSTAAMGMEAELSGGRVSDDKGNGALPPKRAKAG